MKKFVYCIFLIFFTNIIYSEGNNYKDYLESRVSKLNMVNNVADLQRTHWIPETDFADIDRQNYFDQEIQEEFIFLENNRLLIINTGVSTTYLENRDEYIFDTILISIYGEFEYTILNNEEIEFSNYHIKIMNGELYIMNKNEKITIKDILSSVF